jgi:hypothetical protein
MMSYLLLVEAIGERKRKKSTRAVARLASPGQAGRGDGRGHAPCA